MAFLNAYMNSKLGTSSLLIASDLYRSFHRSLAIVEKNEVGSYSKYIVKYAKKLKTAVKTVRNQASKSKALDNITNAITEKCKRDSNDNYENKLNKEMVKENYATSARESSNDFTISSFSIEMSSK
ncbi:13466_t:CDS:2 [Funneliformis geosporum]|uniref:13466_t:CDS:1 n=1 Tax=Funneliformis geosporum TaxID=1117311 RepID=A0A9W4SFG1_9GLOM|nr:13466_t:CDS:2 [Funneliformis geosporum]